LPEVQQETKEGEGFYFIKVEINDGTTSFNKDKTITLSSKDENCEKLLKLAEHYLS
tara:strand:+ start:485 stop:652 length:168 start_codon:yes stop_codon:yes gene_type:complete